MRKELNLITKKSENLFNSITCNTVLGVDNSDHLLPNNPSSKTVIFNQIVIILISNKVRKIDNV